MDYVSLGRLLDSTAEAVALRQRRTTATATKLFNLARDCRQMNEDLIATIIDHSLHDFDEFDLLLDHSSEDSFASLTHNL